MKRKKLNGAEDCEVQYLGAVQPGHSAAISNHMLPPVSGAGDKRQKKPTASKHKGFLPQNLESADGILLLLLTIILEVVHLITIMIVLVFRSRSY